MMPPATPVMTPMKLATSHGASADDSALMVPAIEKVARPMASGIRNSFSE
jgi:hypothetical protein